MSHGILSAGACLVTLFCVPAILRCCGRCLWCRWVIASQASRRWPSSGRRLPMVEPSQHYRHPPARYQHGPYFLQSPFAASALLRFAKCSNGAKWGSQSGSLRDRKLRATHKLRCSGFLSAPVIWTRRITAASTFAGSPLTDGRRVPFDHKRFLILPSNSSATV